MKFGIVGDFQRFSEMSISFVRHKCARADSVLRRWHHCTEPLSKTSRTLKTFQPPSTPIKSPEHSSESIRNPKPSIGEGFF